MEKKKLTIGFDLGIASVGWSLIDTTNQDNPKIVNLGVRLFDDPSTGSNAAERRNFRSSRRRTRRNKLRKSDLIHLLASSNLVPKNVENKIDYVKGLICNGLVNENNELIPPIELKVKGLSEQLSNDELIIVLFSYMKHRGAFYQLDEEVKTKKEKDIQTQTTITDNRSPSLKQYDNYLKEHRVYGLEETNLNIFNTDWVKEINVLFEHQKQLIKEFKRAYLELFSRKRDYKTGPGSSKSPTPYGMYYYDQNTKEIKKKPGEYLWETTIGKCSVYPEENRGLKKAPITEVFNLCNDLNNIKLNLPIDEQQHQFEMRYLTETEKKDIWQLVANLVISQKTTSFTLGKISDYLNKKYCLENKIKSEDYKTLSNKDGAPNLSDLKNTFLLTQFLLKTTYLNATEVNFLNLDFLKKINAFFLELAKSPSDLIERKTILENFCKKNALVNLEQSEITAVKENLLKNVTGFNSTSSLSYKAMIEFISYATKININASTYFYHQITQNQAKKMQLANRKYFPKHFFDEEILSSTAKRTFNQAINVLNKIIHLYSKNYEITDIVIEMAREKNSDDEKKQIAQLQQKNRHLKEQLNQLVHEQYHDNNFDFDKLSNSNKIKLLLWQQQDYKDIYDGQIIDLFELLNDRNQTKFHIDHILPYSQCFIDSLNNKVLTKNTNNTAKGKKTPYMWLNPLGKFEEFKKRVEKIYGVDTTNKKKNKKNPNNAKVENLLYLKDLTKYENQMEFIARNLVDTRIATRILLNALNAFFKANLDRYPETKIKVLNGAITNFARYNLFVNNHVTLLPKDRNIYKHHAIDASIIAYLGINQKIKTYLSCYKKQQERIINDQNNSDYVIDPETGEILNSIKDWMYIDQKSLRFGETLKEIYDDQNPVKVKFSKQITTHSNFGLFDQQPLGIKVTASGELKVKNAIDLLNADVTKLSKYFNGGKEAEKLETFKLNKKLYLELNKIYSQYLNTEKKTNPFLLYIADTLKKNLPHARKTAITVYFDDQYEKYTYVRKLRFLETINSYIRLKKGNVFVNSVYTSLNPLEIRIYLNDDNKYFPAVLDARFLKSSNQVINKIVIDETKLKEYLKANKVSQINKFCVIKLKQKLCPNTTLLKEIETNPNCLGKGFLPIISKLNFNYIFEINGTGQKNTAALVEIKPIHFLNKKENDTKNSETNRLRLSLKNLKQYFDFCDIDVLGNISNRKSFEEKFNEL